MSRKDVFNLTRTVTHNTQSVPAATEVERPLLNATRSSLPVQSAALGAISQSLEAAGEKARRADALEQMLAKGQSVVELDPANVDPAPIRDRMPVDKDVREAFIAVIREQGQQTPILVRPKPGETARYQAAFGHRRLDAARALGRPVLAIVREMNDEDLAMAQGQENSARADLSYIERASFAARLEAAKFSRDVIMSALSVDKTALSRMLTIVARTPPEIIEAIGPAPSAGRPRWVALVDLLDDGAARESENGLRGNPSSARLHAIEVIKRPDFASLSTDQRFNALLQDLSPVARRASGEPLTTQDGARVAKVIRGNRRLTLAFDDKATPEFGEFVAARISALYEEFRAERTGAKKK